MTAFIVAMPPRGGHRCGHSTLEFAQPQCQNPGKSPHRFAFFHQCVHTERDVDEDQRGPDYRGERYPWLFALFQSRRSARVF
jgi:hypothetical protein